MRSVLPIILAGVMGTVLGCGSSQESSTDESALLSAPPPQRRGAFETTTDTIHTESAGDEVRSILESSSPSVHFMVQIGAFREPKNAHHVQNLARERFHVPVINDYDARRRLYEIRIGFFATREAAVEFLHTLQKQFPAEYRDSWVVELQR